MIAALTSVRPSAQGGHEPVQESGRHLLDLAPVADPVSARSSGDVAQLGERRVRIAEARGSSPLISTSTTGRSRATGAIDVGRLGRW